MLAQNENNNDNPTNPQGPELSKNSTSQLTDLGGEFGGGKDDPMSLLFVVPLKISVELGQMSLNVMELLQMGLGSVLELEKLAGEPLEIKVNGRDMAKGEVVVVNDKFGIRLTDIIDPNGETTRDKSG